MDVSNAPNGDVDQPHHLAQPTLASNPHNPNSAAYLAYPVKHVVSSLYRRMTEPPDQPISRLLDAPISSPGYYSPPRRTASPFTPPPLTPLTLTTPTSPFQPVLSRSLAEEIRLLVPARLQLVDTWRLAYSLDTDGASLHTLYDRCQRMAGRSQRAGYVIVVRDISSAVNRAIFGAYVSDPPKPSLHYYGTGECFLWKASLLSSAQFLKSALDNSTLDKDVNGNNDHEPPSQDLLELAGLPPPPSADTTNLQRTTMLRREPSSQTCIPRKNGHDQYQSEHLLQPSVAAKPKTQGSSGQDRIRFKAFPYSGINDFMLYCETEYLSIGGGDGHYGLWLDDQLEHGISDPCPTFGNESLSEEGHSFNILGLEVWYIGA